MNVTFIELFMYTCTTTFSVYNEGLIHKEESARC